MAPMTMKMREADDMRNLVNDDRTVNKKKWLESLVSGALSFRRMVKREDLLKVFFVYLCLLHVSPGHPCGRNPISRFQPLTKMLGRDINSLLNLLRTSNPALYQQVQDEWRRYADCVGLVDTGYFKRSMIQGPSQGLDEQSQGIRGQMDRMDLPRGALQRRLRSRRAQRLFSLMRSMMDAGAAVDGGVGVGGAAGVVREDEV